MQNNDNAGRTVYPKKPDCYSCKYRANLPSDYHSYCTVFIYKPFDADIKVIGNPHAIASGWFAWPFNFDPIWIESCNAYEQAHL
jgi:hypothetical protein